jgi:exodeoxyribonuclease-1
MGEPVILLPPQERYWKLIGKERNAVFEENLKWLKENPEIFQQIVTYYREYRYPFIPNLDPDASLYQIGFFSRADEKLGRMFQQASLDDKAKIVSQFSSPDARTLAGRVLCRNYPETTLSEFNPDYNSYLKRINPLNQEDAITDYRGEIRTTPKSALIEINRLKQAGDLNDDQQQLLDDLEEYIKTKFTS